MNKKRNTKSTRLLTIVFMAAVFLMTGRLGYAAKEYKDMVLIPMGEFTMGSGEHYDDPPHKVVLSSFYMDKYEVSNSRYAEFMTAKKHPAPAYWDDKNLNKPNHPVVGVNWFDAESFCKSEGKRLPTEAEWEKAATGPANLHFPWGHEYDHKKSNCCQDVGSTTPVDSYPEGISGYGVYNMGGNVYEWVSDWYDPKYYNNSPALNPKGPVKGYKWGAMGVMKVLRGGSWFAPASSQHTGHRFWNKPENNSYGVGLGFRCAKDAPEDVINETQKAYMQSLIDLGGRKYTPALDSIEKALALDPNNKEFIELRDQIKTKSKEDTK